jgi:lysophospholipase L1-like esterase
MRNLYLLLFIVLAGCSMNSAPALGETDMSVVRYLALGDSYTIGESVPEEERWPNQLARLIELSPQFEGSRRDVEVTTIACTGWTTSELWDGMQEREITPPYDLVSLLIGVNNQYRGYDIEQYREQFVFLLNKSVEYTGGDPSRVVVLSIPDWGVTPFAWGRDTTQIAKEIDVFNIVNREESVKANVHYVDITPLSREALSDPSLIAQDGLHPSGKMYAEWAKLVLPVTLEVLRR